MLHEQREDKLRTTVKGLTKGYWHGPCRTHSILSAACRGHGRPSMQIMTHPVLSHHMQVCREQTMCQQCSNKQAQSISCCNIT